jgi:hypothetical protein
MTRCNNTYVEPAIAKQARSKQRLMSEGSQRMIASHKQKCPKAKQLSYQMEQKMRGK